MPVDESGVNQETKAPQSSGASPAAEGCPPPLQWQEVLAQFQARADAWYLDRPGYRLSGRSLGTGSPLYLLGGFGGTHELYALLAWLLQDQFRCVVWDYPGMTPQTRGGAVCTLQDLSRDVAAVAETAGDAAIDVYAPSFGSLVALQTLREFPGLIRRAILQEGFAHRPLSRFERWLSRACRFYPGSLARFPGSRTVREHNHRRWFPPFDETRWQFTEMIAGRVPVAALAWQGSLIRDADLRGHLPHIQQPVLLLATEGEGAAAQACRRELQERLANATTESLVGAGQYPYLTHPHRVAKIVREFLQADQNQDSSCRSSPQGRS
ncbi:MAG: alpha/beta fold hydrolase [Planctomycetales bacterium]